MNKTGWKVLQRKNGRITSNYDGSEWTVGKWREVEPLNCSKLIPDARDYVAANCLARVEYRGKVITSNGKLTCETMRIIKVWDWKVVKPIDDEYHANRKPIYDEYLANRKSIYDEYHVKRNPIYDEYLANRKSIYDEYLAKRKSLAIRYHRKMVAALAKAEEIKT